MRFSPDLLDEIRARLPVSEVVGRRVRLKKQGREWAGLSPFNQEKTPSFFVNDQKGFYHCFSSGKHGDIFRFVMETEGVGFPEAVERLAAAAGVALPKPEPREIEREQRRASLQDVAEMAARFFEAALAGREGAAARAYLERRGILSETQRAFRLGYAPADRTALKRSLAGQGVPVADMVEAGLLVSPEEGGEPFDRFRERVMFPIHDLRGRVVAFGGRALSADARAKYLNSPETPLFHKGGLLFNHHRARGPAREAGTVVVVEGYMDAIALAQAGIAHVVAPLGTALTEDQLVLLWRMGPEPVMCFDGDKAGRRAAWRAVDLALPHLKPDRSLSFAFLPEGQDPDDLVRAQGRAAAEAVIARAIPLVEVLWAREAEAAPLDTPERRAGLERRLNGLVATIADPSVRHYYGEAVRARLREFGPRPAERRFDGRFPAGRRDRPRLSGRGFSDRSGPTRATDSLRNSPLMAGLKLTAREAALVLCVVHHPGLLDAHAEAVSDMELSSPELDRIRGAALEAAGLDEARNGDEMAAALARAGLSAALAHARAALAPGTWWAGPGADPRDAETAFLHSLALHVKARTLHKELRAAEAAFGIDPSEENEDRLLDLQRQFMSVEGTEAAIEGFGAASGRLVRGL